MSCVLNRYNRHDKKDGLWVLKDSAENGRDAEFGCWIDSSAVWLQRKEVMLFSMRKIGCPGFIKKTSLGETKSKFSLSLCGSDFHSWGEKL